MFVIIIINTKRFFFQGEPRRLASTKSHEDKEAIAKKIEEIQYSQVALLLVALDVRKQ